MKNVKIVGLLLLVAFIAPMGLNEVAFAAKKGFVTPAWSQKLPANQRFQLVLDDEAVLDKETGLVWERSPSTDDTDWSGAISRCYTKEVGGRKGWRLPTVEELASLVDTTQSYPALPAGHPFQNVQSDRYWSATTDAEFTDAAWRVSISNGSVSQNYKGNSHYVWCVRGGHGYDAY